jgi:hypothetical protein
MTGRPIKFRILEMFLDGREHWNDEVVRKLQKEYGMPTGYGRDSINFDIIELAAGGMLTEADVKAADPKSYGKSALLHSYRITNFGRLRADQVGIRLRRDELC